MKKLFKYIVVTIRLARALKVFMPIDQIYKAKYIVAKEAETAQGKYGETIVRYTFDLLNKDAFNKKYKINLKDFY